MSKMLTIELPDRTADDLAREAAELGLTVGQLVEAMTDQFLVDRSPIFELTEDQIEQIKQSMNDPRPSVPHEEVMARARRILTGQG